MSSTTTSISESSARSRASSNQRQSPRPSPRSRLRSLADTPAIPILLLLPDAAVGPPPALEALLSAAPLTVVLAALVYLPAISLVFWAATHLDPGRVGLLLMSEIVVGVASAAALTDEPFGLRETLGTALILSAAFVEVMLAQRRK